MHSGEFSNAVRNSPSTSASSTVFLAFEPAVRIVDTDVEMVEIAAGRSAMLETPSAASWIFALSSSTVFETLSTASRIC